MTGSSFGDSLVGFVLGLLVATLLVMGLSACGPTPMPPESPVAGPAEEISRSRCRWEQQENADVGAAGAVVRTYLLKCDGDYTGCMMTVWGAEHEVLCE